MLSSAIKLVVTVEMGITSRIIVKSNRSSFSLRLMVTSTVDPLGPFNFFITSSDEIPVVDLPFILIILSPVVTSLPLAFYVVTQAGKEYYS